MMTRLVAIFANKYIALVVFLMLLLVAGGPTHAQLYSTQSTLTVSNASKDVFDVSRDSNENVVVSIPSDNKILVFTASGTFVRQFSTALTAPTGLAIDAQNRLFVTHPQDAKVRIYDLLGNVLGTFGSGGSANGQFISPRAVRILKNGDVLVSDDTRIQRFTSNGTFISTYLAVGSSTVLAITDFDLDLAGNVWVLDATSSKLTCWNPSGVLLRQFGTIGTGAGQLNGPIALCIDRHGFLYVSESQQRRIQKFTSKGIFVSTVVQYPIGTGSDVVPTNILTTNTGDVISGQSGGSGGATVYRPEFPKYRYVKTLITGIGPAGIAYDPVHGLYVSDHNNARQLRVNVTTGAILSTFTGQGMDRPQDVAVSKNGTVYVADTWNLRIQRFNSSGTWLQSYSGLGTGGTLHSVAVDDVDNFLYLPKTSDGAVLVSPNGTVIRKYGTKGTGNGGFSNPWCVKYGFNNDLYISDGPNQLVQVFDVDGAFLRQFALAETGGPDKLAISKIGQVAVAPYWDRGYFKIYDITNDVGTTVNSSNGIALTRPKGMVFLENNNLLVADAMQGAIYVYEPYYTTDVTPPLSTFSRTPDLPSTQWTQNNVSVTITATDPAPGLGIKEVHYSVNMGQEQISTASTVTFTLSETGVNSIAYWSVDKAGNVETTKLATVRIDKVAPSTLHSRTNGVVSLTSTDSHSGVATTYFKINGGLTYEYLNPLPDTFEFITYWSLDRVGNTEGTKTFWLTSQLASIRLARTYTVGGQSLLATVSLTAASSTPSIIALSSDNPNLVVPASITIEPGQTSKTFSIDTKPVGTYTQTTVSATFGTQLRSAQLDILPPSARISVTPRTVIGGEVVTLLVTLDGPAPAGGTMVTIESDNTSVLPVPATITVPEGQVSASIQITSIPTQVRSVIAVTASTPAQSSVTTVLVDAPRPTSLTLTPTSVSGGSSFTGRVTLQQPAPAGGLVVSISSSDSTASVPANVAIEAGKTTTTFAGTTSAVAATKNVIITASLGENTVKDTLRVIQPGIKALFLLPSTVTGGSGSQLTVSLDAPAPVGGWLVNLTSSDTNATFVPTATIPAGQTAINVPITTKSVLTRTAVMLTATDLSGSQKTTLVMEPVVGLLLRLSSSSIAGGNTVSLTVDLAEAAPKTGATVALTADSSALVVPASIKVLAGSKTATVVVKSLAVAVDTTVRIAGTVKGFTDRAELYITAPRPQSVTFTPAAVLGGKTSTGTVKLTGLAPVGGLVVLVTSDNAAATVPATVIVPAGKNLATFVVTTKAVTGRTQVSISAAANGTTISQQFAVQTLTVQSVVLKPLTVVGGIQSSGTVTLNGVAPSGGLQVDLTSSMPGVSVPNKVFVPAGKNSVTFTISTEPVGTNVEVTLSARANGDQAAASLLVTPVLVSSLTVAPTTVVGGTSAIGTIRLTAAPGVDTVVMITSANQAIASVPATVLIRKGVRTETFIVTTTKPVVQTTVTLNAVTAGVPKTGKLTVKP